MRRRNNPAERRAQILAEAVRLMGEAGYYRFTIEALAERCGVSKGGLLHHYGTKEQLLLGVLEECDRRNTASLRSEAPAASAIAEALRMMLEHHIREPELARLYTVLSAEALDAAHPAHGYFRERRHFVLEALTDLVAPLAPDPEATARELHALMDGLALQWFGSDQSFDLVRLWEHAIRSVLPNLASGAPSGGAP